MDFKRNVLIAGLAIVSYLLLLAWNEDYPRQLAQNNGSAPVAVNDLPDIGNLADIPQQVTPASDLPEVQLGEPQITRADPIATNLISVQTPVHILRINPVGGDIVDLSLPGYPVALDAQDQPFQLLSNGSYVSRSGLIGRNGPDEVLPGRPVYQSSQSQYVLESGELNVDLNYRSPEGVSITKRFIFNADDYLIRVQYLVDNESTETWTANLFGQIRRDNAPDPSSIDGFGVGDYIGAVLTTPEDPYKKVSFRDIERGGTSDTVQGGWIAFSQRYFLSSWIPDSASTHTYTTRRSSTGEYLMEFVSPPTLVPAGSDAVIEAGFWAGPKHQYRLEEVAPNLNLTVDYGWLWFIAQPIFWLLTQINNIFGNYGWSIIALTIVIKVLFFKLSGASYRSMAKMRRLTPKVNQLKDRYGDDKQKLMQAQMELWRKEKVNPLGGCLPMLLQMPVLIGIYWVLSKSVELRQADFILWYHDLSAMDPYFILPLIMGASMYISQTMMPITTADPMQAKIMRFMPVIFTVFFLWFPSGLVLYWLVSNIFNIVQQWFVNKQVDASYEKKAA